MIIFSILVHDLESMYTGYRNSILKVVNFLGMYQSLHEVEICKSRTQQVFHDLSACGLFWLVLTVIKSANYSFLFGCEANTHLWYHWPQVEKKTVYILEM